MDLRLNGQTDNKVRLILPETGLAHTSEGLVIATICDNEAVTVHYQEDSDEIESISVLGTFEAPSIGKCRFAEVDATNHPGLYEFQFEDARFAVEDATKVIISVSGAGLPDTGVHYEIALNAIIAGPTYLHSNQDTANEARVAISAG